MTWKILTTTTVTEDFTLEDQRKALLDGKKIMCSTHPGNGLLLWNNGDAQCYECGKKKYGEKVVFKPNIRNPF